MYPDGVMAPERAYMRGCGCIAGSCGCCWRIMFCRCAIMR
jgi:hypothetical protein